MLTLLFYVSLTCGTILVALLLLSLLSGLDLDFDFDTDIDPDAGGLGVVKSVLTFFSIGAWVVRLVLLSSDDPVRAFLIGAAAGAVGVYILSLLLRFLLSQQENVNWSITDAVREQGTVYLRIPAGGEGLVRVRVAGTQREFKARSAATEDIPTGASVVVDQVVADGILLVHPVD